MTDILENSGVTKLGGEMRKIGMMSSPFVFSQLSLLDQSSISFYITLCRKKKEIQQN